MAPIIKLSVSFLALAEGVALRFIDLGCQTQLGSWFCDSHTLSHFENLTLPPAFALQATACQAHGPANP